MKHKCFEDFLYDKHAEQYEGLDDGMADDWGEWIAEMDPLDMVKYADEWMKSERGNK